MDLTGQNPNTRIPNSEFHSLNGLRDWLRVHCVNELGEPRNTTAKCKIKNSSSLHAQVGTKENLGDINVTITHCTIS